jgi:hypothetical protein
MRGPGVALAPTSAALAQHEHVVRCHGADNVLAPAGETDDAVAASSAAPPLQLASPGAIAEDIDALDSPAGD